MNLTNEIKEKNILNEISGYFMGGLIGLFTGLVV